MKEEVPSNEPGHQPPDLSVCIVSYRCRDTLLGALAAMGELPEFTETAIETIVVDNGSADGTAEAVRDRFPGVRLAALGRNLGFARAANIALLGARSRNVLLLNPDVRVTGDTLARAVRFLDSHPDVGVLSIRLRYPDGRVQGTCGHFPDAFAVAARSLGVHGLLTRLPGFRAREGLPYFCFPGSLHDVDLVLGAFLMVRRDTLERVGVLDESYFLYGEDLDWCRRARALGIRIVYDPSLEAVHAQGSSAAKAPVTSLRHFHRSAVRYFEEHERPGLPPLLGLLARGSLTVRHWLALTRHVLGFGAAHRIYLVLRATGDRSPDAPVAATSD